MIDVGEKYGSTEVAMPSKQEIYYPCIHLKDVDLPALNEVGKDVTLMVKGSVKSIRETEKGLDIEIEVQEVGIPDGKNKADEALEELSNA